MSVIANLSGTALGIKLVNGKLKPKYGSINIITTIIFILIILVFFALFLYGIINLNLEFIIVPGIGIISLSYILLIGPVLQNSKNYYITFQSEDLLQGFELFYKGKKVNIDYIVDNTGRIAFASNKKKLSCIAYADGTKMSDFTKYRIMNYFSKWLSSYNLLSKEVTLSLE